MASAYGSGDSPSSRRRICTVLTPSRSASGRPVSGSVSKSVSAASQHDAPCDVMHSCSE
ncbi:Uncharacterised protein [Mycobacteroides abscessus]|nr:Uncharacterised protein [Mycobacteroides abscessus]